MPKQINLKKAIATHACKTRSITLRAVQVADFVGLGKGSLITSGKGENTTANPEFKLANHWRERLSGIDTAFVAKLSAYVVSQRIATAAEPEGVRS